MKTAQCPFCDSTDTELFSLFGQTLLGSQYYCRSCKSIFEAVRFEENEENEEETKENRERSKKTSSSDERKS